MPEKPILTPHPYPSSDKEQLLHKRTFQMYLYDIQNNEHGQQSANWKIVENLFNCFCQKHGRSSFYKGVLSPQP